MMTCLRHILKNSVSEQLNDYTHLRGFVSGKNLDHSCLSKKKKYLFIFLP